MVNEAFSRFLLVLSERVSATFHSWFGKPVPPAVEIGLGLRDGTFGVPVSLQRRQTGLDLTPDHSLLHFLLLLVSVIDLLPWICSLRNALRLTLLSPGVVKQVTRPENYSLNFNNE